MRAVAFPETGVRRGVSPSRPRWYRALPLRRAGFRSDVASVIRR